MTRRALESLDAELRRRERLFARAGANDLDTYRRSALQHSAALGRLVLVIDEFAALADELPDFVTGLIGLAQRGRSLGVHLVLATQRPSGVISPEIRANTAVRIALRVTDPGESADVITADNAAGIDKDVPGRAFLRAGSALTEVQTARVSGPAPTGGGVSVTLLDEWGRTPVGVHGEPAEKTDLQLLVDALREASARAGIDRPPSPWLAPLPGLVAVDDLPAVGAKPQQIPIGLIDLPAAQQQETLLIDLALGGPTLVAGGPGSGRSCVLRAFAATAASRLDPAQLHLYALDCAGGSLRGLAGLPHCGAVVSGDDFTTAARLLARLSTAAQRRQRLLAESGSSTIEALRSRGGVLPHVVLLLDGWEGFLTAADDYDAGRSVDALLNLLRESASAGFTVLLAGDRGALAARVAGTIGRRFVLRLADRADYALAGVPPRALPDTMPPGRGVRVDDGAEIQFAVLGNDPGPEAQQRAVNTIAAAASVPPCVPTDAQADAAGFAAPAAGGPPPLRPLPVRVRLADLEPARPPWTVLGAGGDAATAVVVDLFAGDARWLVAGPPRSGRSTVLRAILAQLPTDGLDVLVAAPRRSPLAADAAARGVALVGPDAPRDDVPPRPDRPLLVLVDDSESYLDTTVGDALADLLRSAHSGLAAVVAARSEDLALTYRGVAAEVRRSRTGLLLQPDPGDGDLLGVRLPRTRAKAPPGRGLLVADQPQLAPLTDHLGVLPLQVATP